MDNKYSEELELIMSMYRNGKITGEQKDELISALDKRRGKGERADCKKIVFRVITEKRKADAAEIVRVLSDVAGVDSVTFDERNALATVIGEFDVDGIIAAAREGDIRLRVRDIDINYEPEPKPTKPIVGEPLETAPDGVDNAKEDLDAVDASLEKVDSELNAVETELGEVDNGLDAVKTELDDVDAGLDEFETELDELEKEFDELEDEFDDDALDDDDEDDEATGGSEEEDADDEVKINIDDSRSLSEFLKGLGAKISDALDAGVKTLQSEEFGKKISDVVNKGVKAADEAGKKIADFADNMVIKTCDLGKGVVIKSKAERYAEPYSQMVAFVKIVTDTDVKAFSGEPEHIKAESRALLNDEMYKALCAMLDSQFTGKYKYVGDDVVLKLIVRPKKD